MIQMAQLQRDIDALPEEAQNLLVDFVELLKRRYDATGSVAVQADRKSNFERFGGGSGVPTLNRNGAHDFSVSVPTEVSEQTTIATILSDMDTEIAAIEANLTKTRQLKQGMMHQLITGRIRLIDPG